ncbi:MAG: HAMP domain-containing sensor histidine kinase [Gammaproteobacteria bacterium]|nr:HAMP domain-containing sensor histidine kinase [Gammaproteobacteria bacterium]
MKNNKKYSLVSQIRYKIGIRILGCLLLSALTLLFLTFRDITNNLNLMDNELDSICVELEEFIISQVLIGSEQSIDIKIKEINQSHFFTLEWIPNHTGTTSKEIELKFPFNWEYRHNIRSLDGREFGDIHVVGSFSKDKVFLSELLIRGLLLLSFFVFLLILLFPLAKKIPKEMLLNPIVDILSLLKNPESYFKNESLKKFTEVEEIKCKIIQLIEKIKKDSHDAAIGKMAVQVAHDIRSPLAALDVATAAISSIPEEQRLIVRNATQRINDIANNLLIQRRKGDIEKVSNMSISTEKVSLIFSMLDTLLSEKRAEYGGLSIQFDLNIEDGAHMIFSKVNPIEFKRMISNIINNSVEATHESGFVTVSLRKNSHYGIIEISDNGCGIPKEVVEKLFSSDVSFGKKDGYGLGLQHAYTTLVSMGGKIEVNSELHQGTVVNIYLPLANPPSWFADAIKVPEGYKIVVFDDDASIHQVWSQRFSKVGFENNSIEIYHFSACDQLRDFVGNLEDDLNKYIFLMDYELVGEIETGINLIEELGLHKNAILVTSHYDENYITERCVNLDIRLLPKLISAHVPIQVIEKNYFNNEVILIDDDPLVRTMWELSAKLHGKKLEVFAKVKDFLLVCESAPRDIVIYIDSKLGNGIKGEEISKIIHNQGFKNIYLATGRDIFQVDLYPWLSGVVGKVPPWEVS